VGACKNSVIIFAVGVNDSSRIDGSNRVGLADYLRNVEEMIDNAKDFTKKILCVGLGPIDQSESVPFLLEKTISFHTADRDKYDSALKSLCVEKRVMYVSLGNLMIERHLSEDGVHPLSSGHKIIAGRVLEALAQLS
jgi:lysophospholipase L1-like esterase